MTMPFYREINYFTRAAQSRSRIARVYGNAMLIMVVIVCGASLLAVILALPALAVWLFLRGSIEGGVWTSLAVLAIVGFAVWVTVTPARTR